MKVMALFDVSGFESLSELPKLQVGHEVVFAMEPRAVQCFELGVAVSCVDCNKE